MTGAYWVGEAMQTTDDRDLTEQPGAVRSAIRTAAAPAARLVRVLRSSPCPPT